MTWDFWGERVTAERSADGSGRGVEGFGELGVGDYLSCRDLEEEGVDALDFHRKIVSRRERFILQVGCGKIDTSWNSVTAIIC